MRRSSQEGAVMVVSLLLLMVLTMLVVSSISTGTVNLRIADNVRVQQEAEAVAQLAVNQFMSEEANFDPVSLSGDVVIDDFAYDVTITEPECVATAPADGYSAVAAIAPDDTTWEFTASTDGAGGAHATIRQGVEIRMPADSCPDP